MNDAAVIRNADVAIRTVGLSKAYRIYHSPLDQMIESLRGGVRHTQRMALDGVDLELKRGEVVGILGRNGAGKSTLLKIIAGTLEKTAGHVEVNGRVTAILELGTGFHPEYTGRENIYMGGLCLGMSRAEIKTKIDEVIDFAELRDVIDEPFKTYSTGMQARLTFATTISVDPDILIVDEALSVGDARFQMKCFSWLQRLRDKNATILLVSHDTNTITTFCDRALILEDGKVYAEGDAKEITSIYMKVLFGQSASDEEQSVAAGLQDGNGCTAESQDDTALAPDTSGTAVAETAETAEKGATPSGSRHRGTMRFGTKEAELLDWGLFDEEGKRVSVVQSGAKCRFSMTLLCKADIPRFSCGFAIKDRKGTVVWGVTNISYLNKPYSGKAGETLVVTANCTMWLADGNYFVNLGAGHLDDGDMIDFIDDGIEFKVMGPRGIFTTATVNLDTSFKVESTVEAVSTGPVITETTME